MYNKKDVSKFIKEFLKAEEFKNNFFYISKAEITRKEDKVFIEKNIIDKYKTFKEYEKKVNIYIYLMIYRYDVKYGKLANYIMSELL